MESPDGSESTAHKETGLVPGSIEPQEAGGSPFEALIHALMSVRDLPPAEKEGWRHWFEHYVFGKNANHAADHLPEHARGVLGPASPARTDLMKGYLLRALSRR
ncbi:MAG: hypothetical protein M3Q08_12575 [Pseudomonadota bacterium]|nr:hypothetical protein [Pseudomonadota bacterium]